VSELAALQRMHLEALRKQLEAAEALAAFMRQQYQEELARLDGNPVQPAALPHTDAQV
jgi:hypothetical protein